MIDLTSTLNTTLKTQLEKAHLDLIDLLPVPVHGDRMVRLQALEEMIQEMDHSRYEGVFGYFLQIMPKRNTPNREITSIEEPATPVLDEDIHLANGKLNTLFLLKNADVLIENGEHILAHNILIALIPSGDYQGSIHLKLAKCYELENNIEKSITHYEQSITYQPCFEAYQRLSSLLIEQNRHKEAAETLERALHQTSITQSIRFELLKAAGNSWTRAQNVPNAEKNYKKALDLMPHADEVRANLGALYLQGGNLIDAKRNFQDAVASNPNNDQALAGLGTCYFNEGNKTLAHDYFVRALKIRIQNPNAILYLIRCAYEIKTYTHAVHLLSKFIDTSPQQVSLIYTLAGLEFHLGKVKEAKTHAAEVLAIDPQHAGASELIAMINKFSPSIETQ